MSDVSTALEVIDEAVEMTNPDKVYCLVSGGHDSMTTLSGAREHPLFSGAVHINTGIGVEATREFVRQSCADIKCPLIEYCAMDNIRADGTPDPQDYEELVLDRGFPGPTVFGHGKMYNRLKERAIRRLFRERVSEKRTALLISGVRSQESVRRMGYVERIQVGEKPTKGQKNRANKRRVWVAPIHDWSKRQCLDRLNESTEIHRNPVADKIHKSGECFCGGMASGPEELEELTIWSETRPLAHRLLDIRKRVMEKFPWDWWQGPPKWYMEQKRGQQMMWDMEPESEPGLLCHSCEARR